MIIGKLNNQKLKRKRVKGRTWLVKCYASCYVVCRAIVNCVQCAQEIHLMKGKAQEQPHQRELHNKLISETDAIGWVLQFCGVDRAGQDTTNFYSLYWPLQVCKQSNCNFANAFVMYFNCYFIQGSVLYAVYKDDTCWPVDVCPSLVETVAKIAIVTSRGLLSEKALE